jgi:hypothetical protein
LARRHPCGRGNCSSHRPGIGRHRATRHV